MCLYIYIKQEIKDLKRPVNQDSLKLYNCIVQDDFHLMFVAKVYFLLIICQNCYICRQSYP